MTVERDSAVEGIARGQGEGGGSGESDNDTTVILTQEMTMTF